MVISLETLRELALRLQFDMKNAQYQTLQQEFAVILQQMDLIGAIEGVDEETPMTFPFDPESLGWRDDEPEAPLTVNEVLANAKDHTANMIRIPKVVG